MNSFEPAQAINQGHNENPHSEDKAWEPDGMPKRSPMLIHL
jgi:hypothetical protein